MSGILLGVLSPVWQAKLCRGLNKASRSRLDLTLDDAASFATAVELGCGRSTAVRGGLAGLLSVGRLADAYGIEHVHRAVEWEATRRLTVDTCAELLAGSSVAGMPHLTRTCRELALGEFDALCRTEGFMLLEEEELGALLDADAVEEGREGPALSAVLRWMRPAGAGEPRGKSLVTMPSFKRLCKASWRGTGTMGEDAPMAEELRELLGEAAAASDSEDGPAGTTGAAGRLDPAGHARRGWYAHAGAPRVVMKCFGWMCCGRLGCFAISSELAVCGQFGGKIHAVQRHDLKPAAATFATNNCSTSSVTSVAVWRGWIVVGYESGEIEILETRPCKASLGQQKKTNQRFSGHSNLQIVGALDSGEENRRVVAGLGVSGGVSSRLVSCHGSSHNGVFKLIDSSLLKVWTAGNTAHTWACERTIQIKRSTDVLLAVWGTSAATGHYDYAIRVWDLDSGACQATLSGHTKLICSSAVHSDGQLLVSASKDRTLRVWKIKTATCLRKLDVDMDVRCVAVSEGKIFGGLSSVVRRGDVQTPAVFVWDLHTLEQEGTLWMQDRPVGSQVNLNEISVDQGEVWACSNGTMLVWGWTNRRILVFAVPSIPNISNTCPKEFI